MRVPSFRLRRRLRRPALKLRDWSAHFRRLWLTRTTFIAVTGSCGKSVTVRLVDAILNRSAACYRSRHANLFYGSVATVLRVPASSKYCVREVSAFPRGDIARHGALLRPEIAIVTVIGSDHYAEFRSLEATAREKGMLVEKLPRHGTAILNADEPHVRAMADRTHARVLSFGLSPDADIRAKEISSTWPDPLTLTVVHGDESIQLRTRLIGEHWVTSILAAIACGIACDVDLGTCAKAVATVAPVFGRYSVHAEPGGPFYVLDTHKAPLWTVPGSLRFLASARARRKTAVFGTISDYPGDRSRRYRRIARDALERADRVVFVGPNADHVSKLRQGDLQDRLFTFQTCYQASAFLAETALPAELIYIKASIGDHLERIMLSQLEGVVCWKERCRRRINCLQCPNYRRPYAPPFGLAESTTPAAAIG